MTRWAVVVPAEQWATERLFQNETVTVPCAPGVRPAAGEEVRPAAGEEVRPAAGEEVRPVSDEEVLLVAGDAVVALGRVVKDGGGEVVVGFTRRAFEEPVPAGGLTTAGAVTALTEAVFAEFAARLGGDRDRRTWLVSVDLPIEAATQAEAVRLFWSYVRELGPAELPAFISPSGNELAMQAFVLGEQTDLDPEEDDD